MDFNIEHYPNKRFALFSFAPFFSIDLNQSIQERLKGGENLTNALALKILKQIKFKSDVLSYLTRPIVLIPLSLSIFLAGAFIPASGAVLLAARVILLTIGATLFGYFIENYYINNFLPQMSQAYTDQSSLAAEYIERIERSNEEFVFKLA